ncbi:MAG: TraR/DksA family transcriptional regulator [Pirellulaceae bacterium]|nr:TraR/DksA family transcriptional regulator [Pirellulaceae bacterium]
MTRKESIKELGNILFKRRDALKSALAGDLSQLRELQASGDIVDLALDTSSDEISSQLAEVESRELKNIEAAMEKIKKGDYGLCEGCKKAIPLARLQALPYAYLCIKCQIESENGTLDLSYEGSTVGSFQRT